MKRTLFLIILSLSFNTYSFEKLSTNLVNNQTKILDTIPPTAPIDLTAQVLDTSVALSWGESTDNVGLSAYSVYNGDVFLAAVHPDERSYVVIDLEPETTYEFRIRASDTSGNFSSWSTIIITTSQKEYCFSVAYNRTYEYIDYVGIGSISNTTDGRYGDYTDQVADLSFGFNTIELSAGFSDFVYVESFAVWIDFNQNRIFDLNEQVVSVAVAGGDITSHNFIIPEQASLGNTRMRVAMKWEGVPVPCASDNEHGWGEVEDYTINIIGSQTKSSSAKRTVINEVKKESSIEVYPNPATKYINLEMTENKEMSFSLRDLHGREVKSGKATRKNRIELNGIQSGMYIMQVSDGNHDITKKIIIK